MHDECEAIVRELAGMGPLFEVEDRSGFRWCCFCGLPEESQLEHAPNCLYVRAQRVVARLDAANDPTARHIRFSKVLNQSA